MAVNCGLHGFSYENTCPECVKLNNFIKDMTGDINPDKYRDKPNKSDGGPSSYYDFDPGWSTFNDFMEDKAKNQWGAYSLHLKDTGKALCRFGAKDGTTKAYDARKIIYSGLRLLGMIEGKEAMRQELEKLIDDKQFT